MYSLLFNFNYRKKIGAGIMKKIAITFILIFSITLISSCYDDNGTATVKINLGNIPMAQNLNKKSIIDRILCLFSTNAYAYPYSSIIKLHLVAWQNDSPLALSTIDTSELILESPTDAVEFEVPAGDDITIVVLGEETSYATKGTTAPSETESTIRYYGKSESINLTAGGEATVQVSMGYISSIFNPQQITGLSRIEWDAITGATGYKIYDVNSLLLLASVSDPDYTGTLGSSYDVSVEFSYIEKESETAYIYLSYC